MSGRVDFRPVASREDATMILRILNEAAEWLSSRGVVQWPPRFRESDIESYFTEADVFLGWLGDEAVATFSISWCDPLMETPTLPPAGYLNRVAVRRDHAGRGIGTNILSWASAFVRSEGRRYLRGYCNADNGRLIEFYTANQCRIVGEYTDDYGRSLLLERDARQPRTQTVAT